MQALRTPGDYQAAVSRREIEEWERAVQAGEIVLVACPKCGAETTQHGIDTGEHELDCSLDRKERMT